MNNNYMYITRWVNNYPEFPLSSESETIATNKMVLATTDTDKQALN